MPLLLLLLLAASALVPAPASAWPWLARLTTTAAMPSMAEGPTLLAGDGALVVVGSERDGTAAVFECVAANYSVGAQGDPRCAFRLKITAPRSSSNFGASVAVVARADGLEATVAVGSTSDSDSPTATYGAMQYYTCSKPNNASTTWTCTRRVRIGNPNGVTDTRFGSAVAMISNATLLTGAPRGYPNDDGRPAPTYPPGAVYAHTCTRTPTWNCTLLARLDPDPGSNTTNGGLFGDVVATSLPARPWVVVGAPYELVNGYRRGTAYVFSCVLGPGEASLACTRVARLVAPLGGSSGYFGASVALAGDTLVVGDPSRGRAVVYHCTDDAPTGPACTPVAVLADPYDDYTRFGESVAVLGRTVAVGNSYSGSGIGAVLLHTCSPSDGAPGDDPAWPWTCRMEARLRYGGTNSSSSDYVGAAVLLRGATVFAGVPGWKAGTTSTVGSVTAFDCPRTDPADGSGSGLSCRCESVGFAPSDCEACLAAHYGATCLPCARCELHGVCSEGIGGACACDRGWAGVECSVCAPNWAGADCAACAPDHFGDDCTDCDLCERGTCVPGRAGECVCNANWSGPTCAECAAGRAPPTCDGCLPAHYGAACTPCTLCANGACRDGVDGACVCDAGWSGERCDVPSCVLTTAGWRAQYSIDWNGTVASVEDVLTFDAGGVFSQNITALPFQSCASNSAVWDGLYAQPNATALVLDRVRCTVSAPGCVQCGATGPEAATIAYAPDCFSVKIQFDRYADAVTYFDVFRG